MKDLPWPAVVAGVLGTIGFVWQVVTYVRQRIDKQHETRLRMHADLHLRLHDRSAQLLRELLDVVFEAHHKILMLGARAGLESVDHGQIMLEYNAMMTSVHKLEVVASSAPPEMDTNAMVVLFNKAADAAFQLGGVERKAARAEAIKIGRLAADGLDEAKAVAKRWNALLWKATAEVQNAFAKGKGS